MRIVHIALGGCLKAPPVAYGLTADTGGHIAYVLGAARAQAARGDRVEIVTRAFDDSRLGAIHAAPRETVAPGCTIRRLATPCRDYLSKEALEAEIPALVRAFLDLLHAEGPPDLIHAHFADAAELARAAEAAFGTPWILTTHSLGRDKDDGAGPGPADPGLARRIAREEAALAAAHAVVASSRDEAERQIAAYGAGAEGRTHRVNPGATLSGPADTAAARALIAPDLDDPDRPIILAVARPIPKKNLGALVEAYGGSPALQAAANLVIVAGQHPAGPEPGDGDVRGALVDALDRFGLSGKVALPPRHTSRDVAGLYALAARGGVFCNPALSEPFGLTLVEAAQSGVPLVATRNGGPADIVRAIGSGRLVDPVDREAIAAALLAWFRDDLRGPRMRAARNRARTLFDWSRWAGRVAAIAADLAAPPPAEGPATDLLASDIDGTLTGDAEGAARFARWAAQRPASLRFVVATGRPVTEARRILDDWGLPRPDAFVTSCGSEIWRWTGPGRLALCRDYAAGLDWPRAAAAAVLDQAGARLQAPCEQRPWKLGYLGDAAEGARLGDALRRAGIAARVVPSHGRFIDVMPRAAGKANAIRFEAARAGVPLHRCAAAGDSGNDADMLMAFGRAILPSNALPELSGLPGHRTVAAHADGVLEGLARIGLAAPAVRERSAVDA